MASTLSLPPYNFIFINFFSFTLFFLFLIKKSKIIRKKNFFFFYGWLFGFGFFITNLYWISISLSFDENFKFLIPLTIFLLPAFLALFYGFISYFFIIFKPKNIVGSFFIFSLIFGIIEFLRGSILTGFPWNLVVYSFSNQLEFISVTSILGTYGLNLFCISLFTCPALFIMRESRIDTTVGIIFILTALSFFVHGTYYKKKFDNLDKETFGFKIRVIGSNISLERFYSDVEPINIIEDLIDISDPDFEKKTIFVWPEGILPDISQNELADFDWLFKKYFNRNHLLIIGINSKLKNELTTKYYNSLSIYDNELNLINSYNKINLVPFGEFLPYENILKKIGLKTLTNNYQSFSKGDKRKIIDINANNIKLKILPLICYEIIYSGKLFNDNNFDLIMNISEDGWFGESEGPIQHFNHSIFRAIESGKYIVRSSNNGSAAIINPTGFVEKQVNFGEKGYVDLEEKIKTKPTIFSKYGNKIFGLLILLYISLIFSFNKFKND